MLLRGVLYEIVPCALHYAFHPEKSKTVSLFKSASIVSLFTLLSRVTGLVRELLVASAFGASVVTDAFNVAFRLPNMFRRLFAEGAFSQAFVPVLAAAREQEGDDATRKMVDHVATVLFWVLVLFCLVGVILAPVLVWAMASGLMAKPGGYDTAVTMTRWMFPYIGFMSLVALAAGVLNTWKNYTIPAATPVLLNICMITAAWLGGPWFERMGIHPVYALCAGVMVGGLLQLTVQLAALARIGMFPRIWVGIQAFRNAWRDPHTRRVAKLMLPAILGVSVAQISLLINTQIASHLQAGSVSWLSYADRLMEFPTAMLGVALGVVLMPQLARAKASGNAEAYSSMLDWGLRVVVLLSIPCALALLAFAQPVVSVLYHYGAFKAVDVEQTTLALMGYGVGLLGLVAIKVLAPAYYAKQDIKTPVKIAVGVLVATQVMNWFFVPKLGVAGLSLSIGLAAMCNAGMLLFGLLRRGSYVPSGGWGKFALQVLGASLLMVAFLMWAQGYFEWVHVGNKWWRIVQFVLVTVVAMLLYFTALAAAGFKLRRLLRR